MLSERVMVCSFIMFVFGGLAAYALRTGQALTRGGKVSRQDNPVGFWVVVGTSVSVASIALFVLVWP
jgi:hypothetical protein